MGKAHIGAAFRDRRPIDELVLLDETGTYAWRREPSVIAGRILVEVEGAKIVGVLVQAFAR